MKPFLIIFFTILLIGTTKLTGQIEGIKHYELKGQAYQQADSILNIFMKVEYPALLKKYKLKMNCANCTGVFMDVVLFIEPDGHVVDYVVTDSKKCAVEFDEEMQAEFVFFFVQINFPPSLRDMHLQYRLGTSLKC